MGPLPLAATVDITSPSAIDLLQVKSIATNNPTRFSAKYLIVYSVLDSKQALKLVCDSDEWEGLVSNSNNAQQMYDDVRQSGPDSRQFWGRAQQVQELLAPISDAIHQLEADQPYLSQVISVTAENIKICTSMNPSYSVALQGTICYIRFLNLRGPTQVLCDHLV